MAEQDQGQKQVDIEKAVGPAMGQALMLSHKANSLYQNIVELLLGEIAAMKKQSQSAAEPPKE